MVNRRHFEKTPAGFSEVGHLNHDRQGFDDENAAEEELTEIYDGETDETEENPRRKFVKTIIITNKND